MIEDTLFKVLWVEDDQSIIESYQIKSEIRGIELEVVSNWEEAEDRLITNYNEYSAIVLDAFCKIKKEDRIDSETFLGYASVRLSRIFGERHKFIPWYVLSAGTMNNFDVVQQLINSEERQRFDSVWGPMKYIKGASRRLPGSNEEIDDEDYLFDNICNVAKQTGINAVLFRHSDVFKYVGEGRIFDYVEVRRYILKMLSALYYPEENLNFKYEGNHLRKVVEYLFRTANKYGLLPDELFKDPDNDKKVVLQKSSKYLAGLDVDLKDGRTIRYGNPGTEKEKDYGDKIFVKEIASLVKNIIHFGNIQSHTSENNRHVNEENNKEIFFGYGLQLCHVIKWFGEYIENNKDVEKNKSMCKKFDKSKQHEGKEMIVEQDEEGHFHCSECHLPHNAVKDKKALDKRVVLYNVSRNNDTSKDKYPYHASFKLKEE